MYFWQDYSHYSHFFQKKIKDNRLSKHLPLRAIGLARGLPLHWQRQPHNTKIFGCRNGRFLKAMKTFGHFNASGEPQAEGDHHLWDLPYSYLAQFGYSSHSSSQSKPLCWRARAPPPPLPPAVLLLNVRFASAWYTFPILLHLYRFLLFLPKIRKMNTSLW